MSHRLSTDPKSQQRCPSLALSLCASSLLLLACSAGGLGADAPADSTATATGTGATAVNGTGTTGINPSTTSTSGGGDETSGTGTTSGSGTSGGSGATGGTSVVTSGGSTTTTTATPSTSTPDTGGGNTFDVEVFNEDEECDSILDAVYRDFSETHPDFEMNFAGDVVRLNLIEPTLGPESKPVFLDTVGCPPAQADPRTCDNWTPTGEVLSTAENFDQWYRTVDGVNYEFTGQLELVEDETNPGTFVYDNSEFFPLAPEDGYGVPPTAEHLNRNYLFTTEIHVNFTYESGQTFGFRGDDDLWIFVNNRLALDLGSMHAAVEGVIDFDALATELGISPGGVYPMDIFHAERHTYDSNFRFETNIACFVPVVLK